MSIPAQISVDELLHNVESLPSHDLDQFVQRVLLLRAQRSANSLSEQEEKLLQLINRPVPEALQHRYNTLMEQQRQDQISQDEHNELLHLIEQIEQFDLERVQYLVKLAKLRQVSLSTLMKDLGIKAADYV